MLVWIFFLMACFPEIQAEEPIMQLQQTVSKGWLGVRFQEITVEAHQELGFETPLIEVDLVMQDSPAQQYGVYTGDIFSHVNGVRVEKKEDFIAQIQGKAAGERIVLQRVFSHGKAQKEEITVMLGARPEESELQQKMFIGQKAPSFSYIDFSSRQEKVFSPAQGKVVLLDFWATWCGPCLMSMPELKRLHEKYSAQGLEIIGITDEPEAKIRPVARRYSIPYTLGSNRSYDAFRMYSVQSLPTAYLIDKNGVMKQVFIGAGHTQRLEQEIQRLLAE